MWSHGWRDEVFSNLDRAWDLIIIGGGITGAGILGEAVRHGKSALLVEAQDFSSGTSSRSTKLVHGGLRYLRQGHFLLTRKSVRERERLMREGAGLIDNLGFSLAAFPGDQMPKWMYGMGLVMYDALAGKWAHEAQTREEIIERVAPLGSSKVTGGYRYFDAQTDDSRLVIRVLREAVRQGGVAINYAKASSLLRDSAGKVHGVVVTDTSPEGGGRTAEVKAKVVINATGAWADDLRRELGQEKRLRRIRGSHLTFAQDRVPIHEAVSMLHPRDQRAVFAVPWEGVTIVGTTDVDHGDLDKEPAISGDETTYILEAMQKAFPGLEITEKDVISTWSGVRPVIDTGKSDPSKESREHAIWREDGLLTITGGKLTTFALMARDALAAVEDVLGPLEERSRVLEAAPEDIDWPSAFTDMDKVRVLGRFGEEAGAIVATPSEATKIPGTIVLWSELRQAARTEGVVTLSDLLLRRARIGLFLRDGGEEVMGRVREVAQPELRWDDARWEREEAAYHEVISSAYGLPR
jgi:glycerol-3-phosphate dehydrogenase